MSTRLAPSRTSAQYAVRKPLLEWLSAQDLRGLRILDVGCGDRPYERLFKDAAEIVGFDVPGNRHADLFEQHRAEDNQYTVGLNQKN